MLHIDFWAALARVGVSLGVAQNHVRADTKLQAQPGRKADCGGKLPVRVPSLAPYQADTKRALIPPTAVGPRLLVWTPSLYSADQAALQRPAKLKLTIEHNVVVPDTAPSAVLVPLVNLVCITPGGV
jgi:hypothetical protein